MADTDTTKRGVNRGQVLPGLVDAIFVSLACG